MASITRTDVLYVYTDGSSYDKPRRGGIGVRCLWLDENEVEEFRDFDEHGFEGATNNQMELQAAVVGIRKAVELRKHQQMRIEIRSDSRYVCDHVSTAMHTWMPNQWLTSSGKPVENATLWKALVKEYQNARCRVEFKWVKGHAKDIHNKAVDKLAKASAKGYLNEPLHVSKVRKKKSASKTKAGAVEMKGQRLVIRIVEEQHMKLQDLMRYRYEVISPGSSFKGLLDFIYSDDFSLRAGHTYRVSVNHEIKNPRIVSVHEEID